MVAKCDFCGSAELAPVYKVPESPKGAEVLLCGCGLLQSSYTFPTFRSATPSLSSGPDWGNVRHGKSVRLAENVRFIQRTVGDTFHPEQIIDIGSNRGRFCRFALDEWKPNNIHAIEPDASVVRDYPASPVLKLQIARFEHVEVPKARFDFAYCSHTLEHAHSASQMLRSIYAALKPGALAFVEVPSVLALGSETEVEEFFIDKHSFHFHPSVLEAFACSLGFESVARQPSHDRLHVSLLLRHPEVAVLPNFPTTDALKGAAEIRTIMGSYGKRLAENRKMLAQAREKIEFLATRQKVAFWGAGRQLDAFIRHSNFDLSKTCLLVDEHLYGIIDSVRGTTIASPNGLRFVSPQVLVVFARGSFQEIADKARRLGVKNIIRFSDLLRN